MFGFKKAINVDLYTHDKNVYELFKPDHSKKFIPDWWRKMPSARLDTHVQVPDLKLGTMKTCPAIIGFMKQGFVIPSHAGINAQKHIDGKIAFHVLPQQYANPITHDKEDYENHKPGLTHMKFELPWRVVTQESIQWLWTQPTWHQKNPLSHWASPGTIDFKYTHVAEYNYFLPTGGRLSVEPGDPIVQLIPLSERPIKLNYHLVTEEEFKQHNLYKGWTLGNFTERLKRMKEKEGKTIWPIAR